MTTCRGFRAHDLVLLRAPRLLEVAGSVPMPSWVRDVAEAREGPWAVVRRSTATSPLVPLGIRGPERHQRWAAFADRAAIAEVVRPFDILLRPRPARAALPVFRALGAVAPILDCLPGTAWGPAGSSAHELVTGVPAVRPSSDLDLLLEADRPLDRTRTGSLIARIDEAAAGVRVDIQVETPAGAFALREWLRVGDDGRIALRTAEGPRLVRDPWSTDGGGAS